MPLSDSDYTAPVWLPGSHLQTLVPRYSCAPKTRRFYHWVWPMVVDLHEPN